MTDADKTPQTKQRGELHWVRNQEVHSDGRGQFIICDGRKVRVQQNFEERFYYFKPLAQ